MTTAPLRVAVAGAGLMGRVHARAAGANGGRVTFVTDTDPAHARELARSVSARVESLDYIVRSGAVDVLHVCTPGETHAGIVRSALEAGIHVVCEKPVTPTAADLRDLFAAAERKKVLLCPVYQFPFQRGALQAFAARQSLGTVRHMVAEMCTAGADLSHEHDRARLALDIISHPLSLSAVFGGSDLATASWHVATDGDGELAATGVSGATVHTYVVSTRGRPTSNTFRMIGDSGTVTLDLYHGYSYAEHLEPSRLSKLMRPFASSALQFAGALANGAQRFAEGETEFPGMRELISRFYAAVISGSPSPVSPRLAMDVAVARDAIVAAATASSGSRGQS